NGYAKVSKKGKTISDWNVEDFAKLSKPMRLHEWQVALDAYVPTTYRKPFGAWKTTHRLPWYVDYNKVKHDREIEFRRATLGNLVDAMSAVYVLLMAQFFQYGEYGSGLTGP